MENKKVNRNPSLIALFAVLIIFASPHVAILILKLAQGNIHGALVGMYRILATLFILLIPLLIFNLSVRKYLKFLLPFALLISPLLFIVFIFHKLPTRNMFMILLESERNDVFEFISGIWLWKLLLLLIPTIVFFIQTKIQAKYYLNRKIKLIIVLGAIGLFIVAFSYKFIQRKTLDNSVKVAVRTFFRDTPLHTAKRIYKAVKAFRLSDNQFTGGMFGNLEFKNDSVKAPQLFVLVIGESSRYGNWGINGYHRNTSPKLSKILNLVSLDNIISPSFNTIETVPFITTSATVRSLDYKNTFSIIDMFKATGYTTYWISNQSTRGNTIGEIASGADYWIKTKSSPGAPNYDQILVNELKGILNKENNKALIILHTYGSHYPYQNRYPNEYLFFEPATKKNRHIPLTERHKESIINAYDNSILYTDYILHQLISALKNTSTSSVMFYVSDHGENLFDYPNIGFGRGYGKLTKYVFQVPVFIWYSDKYKSNNGSIINNLHQNKGTSSSSDLLFYTFAGLSGIKWFNYDSTLSMTSSQFEAQKQYFISKNTLEDYQKLIDPK